MTNQSIISLILSMYTWFNQIVDPTTSFNPEDLQKYFTPNFVMEMNGIIVTQDYESLFQHFKEFREGGYSLEVQMPLQEIVISDDKRKCVAKYNILKKAGGKDLYRINVIAIWHISPDGRLERMNEVVNFEKVVKVYD